MSNRRRAKDDVELKLLEVADDPAYRQEKKTVQSRDTQSDTSSVVGIVKRRKTLH